MTSPQAPSAGLGSNSQSFSYRTYKQETSQLSFWIINTSNALLGTGRAKLPTSDADDLPSMNTTGRTTVQQMVKMCRLIGNNVPLLAAGRVPGFVFALFQSVLAARRHANSIYERVKALGSRNPNLERYNKGHRHFIESLQASFDTLGGQAWAAALERGETVSDGDALSALFTNRFALLRIEDEADAFELADEPSDPGPSRPQSRRKPNGKGKKGERTPKAPKAKPAPEPVVEIPLEDYGIITDSDDYMAAVFMLLTEWEDCRDTVQDALGATAVAGAVSNAAVARVRRSELAIFEDFPDRDSFATVLQHILGDDLDAAAQDRYSVEIWAVPNDAHGPAIAESSIRTSISVDIKEQFLVNTYRDLVDFATDFQHNRTGRPTKRMEKELRIWDPLFDLRQATKEERLAWRRVYTIKWLYDLVNLFSSIVVQRNKKRGENHVYEDVDWSPSGPWAEHRRLFGLNEFTGVVTTLAFQKPATDIRRRIRPHHVFQLQCMVDAMTASRGWTHRLRGHILERPPTEFQPQRDIELFLDRNNERLTHGVIHMMSTVQQLIDKQEQEARGGSLKRLTPLLQLLGEDFVTWLGTSKYAHWLEGIPATQFTSTNPNGLWEYSPYLCAVGLVEALQLSYQLALHLWDAGPEPMLLLHVHNKLVKTGLLRPVSMFDALEAAFSHDFFVNGIAPTKDFLGGFLARTQQTSPREVRALHNQRREAGRTAAATLDLNKFLDLKLHRFFRTTSPLISLATAGWDIDAVPETDMDTRSTLFYAALATTTAKCAAAGATRLPDTDVVRRMRAEGLSDAELLKDDALGILKKLMGQSAADKLGGGDLGPDGYKVLHRDTTGLSTSASLAVAQLAVDEDLTASFYFSRSKLNLFTVTAVFLMTTSTIGTKLREECPELHDSFFGTGQPLDLSYMRLCSEALADDADPILLRAVASAFNSTRGMADMRTFFFEEGKVKRRRVERESDEPSCVVM